jgi:hypothetical protein
MMHQPIDYNDERFYVAETLFIPHGAGRRTALRAMGVSGTRVGAPLVGRASTRDGQPAPPRRQAHCTLSTGAK